MSADCRLLAVRFSAGIRGFCRLLCLLLLPLPATASAMFQDALIRAPNAAEEDHFGFSLALEGETVKATGTVKEDDMGYQTITVTYYEVIEVKPEAEDETIIIEEE